MIAFDSPLTILSFCTTLLLFLGTSLQAAARPTCKGSNFKVVIHGGSGAGNKGKEKQEKMLGAAEQALKAAYTEAKKGEPAEVVVVTAIRILEDSPLFNAGRGGNPNQAGFVELDASIMRGRDRNAGSVAAVRRIKNPIVAAHSLMDSSPHLMFVDRGAETLAPKMGWELVESSYFQSAVDHESLDKNSTTGTVGAVVLDRCGNLAAGTSTGGFATKVPGRVGDSPIIGAGTFAENESCAVSATGQGEIFIRYSAAADTCALVKYKGLSLDQAARKVLNKVKTAGAREGGLIVLNKNGDFAWPYFSKGMLRGVINKEGKGLVAIAGPPRAF